MIAILLVAAIAIGTPASAAETSETTCTEGDLYFAGGSLATYDSGNTEPYDQMVSAAGGADNIEVAIIPAASGTPHQSYLGWRADFNAAGVPNSSIHEIELAVKDDPATSTVDESTWADNGNNASVAQRIEDADIVWMNGGAQSRHVQVLMDGANNRQDTDAMAAVRQTVNCQGGVVGGSSAGAAVAGADMVGSGDSYGAMRDGISTTDTYGDSSDFRAWATQGLGLLPDNVMTGTHFQQRARTARLVRMMWHEDSSRDLTRQDLGFGIGENTVLVFEGGTTRARVIGKNGVTVFDVRNAEATQSSADPDALNIKYVEVHYLSRYDEIDYGGSSVTLYPDTTNKTYDTVANPYYSRNSNGGQWIENTNTEKLMTEELVDNSAETVSATEWGDGTDYTARGSQGVRITYYQMSDSTGHWGDGYADGQGRYFVGSIELDIESVEDGY